MSVGIGEISRKLEACLKARSAIDSAVRVYDDARILVDQATHAVLETERVMRDCAAAVEAAVEAKVRAVTVFEKGVEDLLASIRSAKNIKRGNALDTCLAVREAVNTTAQKVDALKRRAESAAEVESIASAALNTAQSAWTERQRIYENAKASAASAKNSILDAAKIVGL
jgi:hypothetical protein